MFLALANKNLPKLTMAKLTTKKVKKALINSGGILQTVADRIGCTREHLHVYISKHPELVAARQEAREAMIDGAESQLKKSLDEGDPSSVRWYLSRIGKNRGYAEKQEVEHSGAIKLSVEDEAVLEAWKEKDGE